MIISMTQKQYAEIFRCQICGKFISLIDSVDKRKVKCGTDYNYHYDNDFCGYYPEPYCVMKHTKCITKEKHKVSSYDIETNKG